jgi:hypothetical protein
MTIHTEGFSFPVTEEMEPTVLKNKFKFDKSVNVSTLLSAIIILYTLYNGFTKLEKQFQLIATQNQIMWEHFVRDNPLTADELKRLSER